MPRYIDDREATGGIGLGREFWESAMPQFLIMMNERANAGLDPGLGLGFSEPHPGHLPPDQRRWNPNLRTGDKDPDSRLGGYQGETAYTWVLDDPDGEAGEWVGGWEAIPVAEGGPVNPTVARTGSEFIPLPPRPGQPGGPPVPSQSDAASAAEQARLARGGTGSPRLHGTSILAPRTTPYDSHGPVPASVVEANRRIERRQAQAEVGAAAEAAEGRARGAGKGGGTAVGAPQERRGQTKLRRAESRDAQDPASLRRKRGRGAQLTSRSLGLPTTGKQLLG